MILDNQPRLCLFCQDPYTSDRSTGLYCSDECKDDFHNRKKKLRRLELQRKAWIDSLPRPEFPSGKLLESVSAYLEKHNPQVLAGLQKDQKDIEQLGNRQQIVLQKALPLQEDRKRRLARVQSLQDQIQRAKDQLAVNAQEQIELDQLPDRFKAFFAFNGSIIDEGLERQIATDQEAIRLENESINRINQTLIPLQKEYPDLVKQLESAPRALADKIYHLNYNTYPLVVEEQKRLVLPEGTVVKQRKKRAKTKQPKKAPLPPSLPATAFIPATEETIIPLTSSQAGFHESTPVAVDTAQRESPSPHFNHRIGTNKETNQLVIYRPSPLEKDFLTNGHVLAAGKSGSGKTVMQYQLACSFHSYGIPFVWLDFDGGATSLLQKHKPKGISLRQAQEGLGLNPLALSEGNSQGFPFAADWVSSSLGRSFGLGRKQQSVLRKAIEETYQRAGFSVNLNLEAQSYNGTRLFPTFNQIFARLEEIGSKDASTESMLVKLERVLSLPLFEERKLTIKEIFSGSKILNLVCLQSLDTKAAVSLLVLEAIYQYVLSLGETKQIRLALFIDEAHLLAGSEVLSQMMRQARKVGLLLVLGSQSPRDFAPAVLSEAGTYLGLRLEADDARMMASYFGAVTTKEKQAVQRLLIEQTRGEALIRNDHYQPFQRIKLQELTP